MTATRQAPLVGLVTPSYAPAIGGVEKHVEQLARGLVRHGVPVEVITTDPTGRQPAEELRDGVLVRRFPTLANDGVYFVSPQLGSWLNRNAGRYGLLHAHSYHTPVALLAAAAARRHGVPLALTPHYHGTGHSLVRRLLHLPYRPVGAWLVRQAQMVVCVSQAERGLIHDHFGPRVPTLVIPNGVDEVAAFVGDGGVADAPDEATVLLLVGRLEHYKGTERLLRALHHLPPHYLAVIIGDGPARPALERRVRELGLGSRVRLLGRVPTADLGAWYRRADVFVTLSAREAFGITVLEGALHGAPVLLSRIPAHMEVTEYLPHDRYVPIDLAAAPQAVAAAVIQAQRLGRMDDTNGWQLPSWDGVARETLASYQSLLGAPLAL